MTKPNLEKIKPMLKKALEEDIKNGDITTSLIVPRDLRIKANIVLKESGIVAGLDVARLVFKLRNKNVKFSPLIKDGTFIRIKDSMRWKIIAKVSGEAHSILEAERTALNLLSHLSGVATLTHQFVKKVKNYKVKITDTRKTTPNLRYFEKYAVRIGGGYNHRMGLYDGILIKDNHTKATRSTSALCVLLAKKKTSKMIEVEVKDINKLEDVFEVQPDVIMLDNMDLKDIKKAMLMKERYFKKNKKKKIPLIEVSGNVNLSNIRKIAACCIDFISIGALTHSNPALDMALKVR